MIEDALGEARVRVWNFPLSVTPRTQSTPLMLPRQTMRKDDFRAAGESEGLSDHHKTSRSVR
jgi:hypothetical protein